jgi:hypothetical protein
VSALRGDPFSELEQETLRTILQQLEGLDDLIGGWTSKVDARQTGFSLHVKFDKKVSVQDTLTVAAVFENASMKLVQVVGRVVGQLDAAHPAPAVPVAEDAESVA